eukprot:TRINITY_DN24042_c0_g1_i2.p1 TRINITY_DN24042_c0_g1~~TRINITY_DN24042_c0_g1_i2.p1  ORF type:complete len:229 (+),score=16.59 TRINITY_DN24042_c0_g1_i2:142-828(+)
MVNSCSIKGCKSKGKGVFHGTAERQKRWRTILKMPHFHTLNICWRHFAERDVVQWAHNYKLRDNALPCKELPKEISHQQNSDTTGLEVEDSSYPHSEHNYFSKIITCDKESDLLSLKQHKIIRTDVELYSCKDCDKSFSSKDNFRHHSENCNSKDKNIVTKELHIDINIKEENIDENDYMQTFDSDEIAQDEMFSEDPLMLVTEESYQFIDCGDSVKQEIKEEIIGHN